MIGILIDIIGLDDILEIYRIFLGKTPERVRRKVTGPVRWQPVVRGLVDASPGGGAFCCFLEGNRKIWVVRDLKCYKID